MNYNQSISNYINLFESSSASIFNPGDWVKITNPKVKMFKGKIGKIMYQSYYEPSSYVISLKGSNILFYRYEFEKIIPTELNNILDI